MLNLFINFKTYYGEVDDKHIVGGVERFTPLIELVNTFLIKICSDIMLHYSCSTWIPHTLFPALSPCKRQNGEEVAETANNNVEYANYDAKETKIADCLVACRRRWIIIEWRGNFTVNHGVDVFNQSFILFFSHDIKVWSIICCIPRGYIKVEDMDRISRWFDGCAPLYPINWQLEWLSF